MSREKLRLLEVDFYDHANSTVSSVCVTIRWHEHAVSKDDASLNSMLDTPVRCAIKASKGSRFKENKERRRPEGASNSHNRLRPTDRLVLYALRARITPGGYVTEPVRIQELMDECAISRRQVQICLKRLAEQGIINRMLNNLSLSNQEGYIYKISEDIP